MTQIEIKADSIQPNAGRVLVRLDIEDSITKGGILIPEIAKEKLYTGTIVACGRDRITEAGKSVPFGPDCYTGARCALPARFVIGSAEVRWNGGLHALVREEDILGFLEGDGSVLERQNLDDVLDEAAPPTPMRAIPKVPTSTG